MQKRTTFHNLMGQITRRLPQIRGLPRVYRALNKAFLSVGIEPIVKSKMRDTTQMLIDLRASTEENAFYTGLYDDELISIIRDILRHNYSFVDVGANIGFYSVAISNFIRNSGSFGKVISFEPFAGNYGRIKANIALNNLEPFCTVHQTALSDHAGTDSITLREDFSQGSKTGNASIATSEEFDAGFETATVDVACLDDIWERLHQNSPAIDLIKLDIEGHEDFCLRGAQDTIKQFRPAILMEVNKPFYIARNVNLDEQFVSVIPDSYSIFCKLARRWQLIQSLESCAEIDNVFLIPNEKLSEDRYKIFSVSSAAAAQEIRC